MNPDRNALEAAQERLNELAAQLESLKTDGLPTADQVRTELVRAYLADMRESVEAKLQR